VVHVTVGEREMELKWKIESGVERRGEERGTSSQGTIPPLLCLAGIGRGLLEAVSGEDGKN
jgi:hypothetical protein